MENWLIFLRDKDTKFGACRTKSIPSTMICIGECIALYLCFTFQLKWTVYLLHGYSFAPSPKNQIRRHWSSTIGRGSREQIPKNPKKIVD